MCSRQTHSCSWASCWLSSSSLGPRCRPGSWALRVQAGQLSLGCRLVSADAGVLCQLDVLGHRVSAHAGRGGYLALAVTSLPAPQDLANVHVSHLSIGHSVLRLPEATEPPRFRSRGGSMLLEKWLNPYGN